MDNIFPCKIETENWYWNRQLQLRLLEININWGFKTNRVFNSRTRKYLAVVPKYDGGYIIQWMTKNDFENADLRKTTSKKLLEDLKNFDI